ncbi:glycosyltransferase family 2 protein [Alicyclobacillus tolerans]|uniref:glycosyltransferase n=1 Tax=Alicyclobacillus tolerans TaxID=90970 RepID=UPI001F469CEE|nr:glycosyltransferase family 2 protein [Alicyclobacillus tolerans]MCF8567607.1 glycosyltransferase family 2 protein [Alicyclobacillus tolerans]
MALQPIRKVAGNRLTAIMQVRNEANRYLSRVLENLSAFCDDIVIVDDASTDNTADVCKSFPKVTKLVTSNESRFQREWELRTILWQAVSELEPDWVIAVDADELYEQRMQTEVSRLINQDQFDWIGFRFYDFWGCETHYRDDEHWNIHRRHTMTLARYFHTYPYFYPKMEHHVPRLPLTYSALPGFHSDVRVKHLGWAGDADERFSKYLRYKERDPNGQWGSLAHYESILDPKPNLVAWEDDAE